MFTSSNDDNPVRPQHSSTDASSPACRSAALSSLEHYNQHHIYTQNLEQFYRDFEDVAWDNDIPSTEEHFPTAPLEDDIWSKDPIPDRILCIHKRPHKLNLQCSYPHTYSTTTFRMDLPQSTPQGTTVLNYKQMDFSDISSDFPDIMTTTSDDNIPDLVDISECLDSMQHKT